MTDGKIDRITTTPNQYEARDQAIRTACLDMAVRSNCGHVYDDEGRNTTSDDKLLSAAKKFESYIRGEKFINGISNHPNNPATKFKQSETASAKSNIKGDTW